MSIQTSDRPKVKLLTALRVCLFTLVASLIFSKVKVVMYALEASSFDINTGTGAGAGYLWIESETDAVLRLEDGANIEITGTATGNKRILVAANANVSIILNDVSISNPGDGDYYSPLLLESGASVTLTLKGINTLTARPMAAAIEVPTGATIMIAGDGSLNVNGGNNSAGIGGANGDAGNITINNGSITAIGGLKGAGIGGGDSGNGGNLTINGGYIVSTGGSLAAGIGNGADATGGSFHLTGGVLFASSVTDKSNLSGGILVENSILIFGAEDMIDLGNATPESSGAGWTYENNLYTILDGAQILVYGTSENDRRLEIASGADASISLGSALMSMSAWHVSPILLNSDSKLTLTIEGSSSLIGGKNNAGINVPEGTELVIFGNGKLSTKSDSYGAGIGVNGTFNGQQLQNAGKIVINSGTIYSEGQNGGAGIGGNTINLRDQGGNSGTIEINGGFITAVGGGGFAAGIGGSNTNSGNITINGGTVVAIGNQHSAGIGGGSKSSGGNITINGGTITATGGRFSSGIGGGFAGSSGIITINGGTVTAKGGSNSDDSGTGIGSGFEAGGGTITINGGIVMATGGKYCTGIGDGGNSPSGGGSISINGGEVTANSSIGGIRIKNGSIIITDGIINSTSQTSIYADGETEVYIDGGSIYGVSKAIHITSNASAFISNGTVRVTASVEAWDDRTIHNEGILKISGGNISASGTRMTIFNANNSTAIVTGGTISEPTDIIFHTSTIYDEDDSNIVLGGNPTFNGRIYAGLGNVNVITTGVDVFAPEPINKTYTLEFTSYSPDELAIVGGEAFLDNFTLIYTPYGLGYYFKPYEGNLLITNIYTVIFYDSTGTSELWRGDFTYNTEITYGLATPTKASTNTEIYTFTGWNNYFEDGVTKVTSKDMSFTALFTTNTRYYTVTFYDDDGITEIWKKTDYEYEDVITYEGPAPAKEASDTNTYKFHRWDNAFENGVTKVTGDDMSFKATYLPLTRHYEVIFYNDYGGMQILWMRMYEFGDIISYGGPTPTKDSTVAEHFTFSGWNNSFEDGVTTVTGDGMSFQPLFTASPRYYTVIFFGEDGITELWKKTDYEYADVITYGGVTPTKASSDTQTFAFSGWNNSFEDGVTTVTEDDMSFTVLFTANTRYYTVTFFDEDGITELWKKTDYEYADVITYGGVTPTKASSDTQTFAFSGWNNSFEDGVTTVTGDGMSFQPLFTASPRYYTVIFFGEDGITELWKKTDYEYADVITYGGVTPTKASSDTQTFAFSGWNNSFEDGVTTVTEDDMSFTVLFTANTRYYTVTFFDEDGITELWKKTDYEYADVITYGGVTPTKASSDTQTFAFSGWNNSFEDGVTTVTGDGMSFQPLFTASPRYYTVIFFGEDGITELWKKTDYEYADVITYGGVTPTKASSDTQTFAFSGWNNSFEDGVTTVTEDDMSFTVLFTANTRYYTVTFFDEDGITELWKKTDYEYADVITYGGVTPTKASSDTQTFAFSGWNNSFEDGVTTVTGDGMSFQPLFTASPRYYTVIFFGEDGITELWKKTDYEYADVITYGGVTPTKASSDTQTFAFSGWNNSFEDGVTTVTEDDMSFTVLFTANTRYYTVTFFDEDGITELWKKTDYEYADVITYGGVTPTKASSDTQTFAFSGWNNSFEDGVTTVTGDGMSFQPLFTASPRYYTVIFFGEDGITELWKKTDYEYADVITYGGVTPTKASSDTQTFAFSGWNNSFEDGVTTVAEDDMSFTVLFTANTRYYTVTFFDEDGITELWKKTDYEYEDVITYGGVTPTKASSDTQTFAFSGWNNSFEDGVTTVTEDDMSFTASFMASEISEGPVLWLLWAILGLIGSVVSFILIWFIFLKKKHV